MKISDVENTLKIDLQVNPLFTKYKDLRDESPLRADPISVWFKLLPDKSRSSRFLNFEHKAARNISSIN